MDDFLVFWDLTRMLTFHLQMFGAMCSSGRHSIEECVNIESDLLEKMYIVVKKLMK